ncbi:hypothetical protein [Vibrio sp. 99-70-13A1]|uniref:hypothetical protein n=1 Tax=Vibrio sp. 99-70-13A1 TaxID=2607601 RepID=UPI001493A27D|nr:hypothetical protein [Vibrio sp. 99-70-13A1]NOH97228.1 hypothetical protein [Vibrio sp. 99-70-13A1]
MHIYIFGNLNVGKSALCRELHKKLPDYDYLSLDHYRQQYSDGSLKGEQRASCKFVADVKNTSHAIVEFTGCGSIAERLKATLNIKCGVLIVVNRCMDENLAAIDEDKFSRIPYPAEYKKCQSIVDTIQRLEESTTLSSLEVSWQRQVWQSYTYNLEQSFELFWSEFPIEHHEVVNHLNHFVLSQSTISSALIYGSLGANCATIMSDVDYFIQTSAPAVDWYDAFLDVYKNDVVHADLINNKITLRYESGMLVEVVTGKQLSEIALYYRESLIHNCEFTIMKGGEDERLQLNHFLEQQKLDSDSAALIASETYFLFCSLPKLLKSEDSYKYSFHTMIIRHYAIQLEHLLLGISDHNYLPKYAALSLPHFPWESFTTCAMTIEIKQYRALYRYIEELYSRLEKAKLIEEDKYFSTRTEFLHRLE